MTYWRAIKTLGFIIAKIVITTLHPPNICYIIVGAFVPPPDDVPIREVSSFQRVLGTGFDGAGI